MNMTCLLAAIVNIIEMFMIATIHGRSDNGIPKDIYNDMDSLYEKIRNYLEKYSENTK